MGEEGLGCVGASAAARLHHTHGTRVRHEPRKIPPVPPRPLVALAGAGWSSLAEAVWGISTRSLWGQPLPLKQTPSALASGRVILA